MLRTLLITVVITCMWLTMSAAQDAMTATDMAQIAATETGVDAYGYTFDDVAVNNGIVLYWYSVVCGWCSGETPATAAEMFGKGMLRTYVSPHTGAAIDPDDGSLDFDGDLIYKDGEVHVQTTKGVVELPGVVMAESDISVQWDPCCCPMCLVPGCVDVTICDWECWDECCDERMLCRAVQWMLWRSFETHEALFGKRPADEMAWFASGLAPYDTDWKEKAPFMDIEYVYKGGDCCYLKKAYVHCCADCCETKCNSCEPKCKQDTCTKQCKPKCESKCAPKCESKCAPKCESKCAPKCESKCKPKCESKCKPKCETKCAPKCKQNTCTKQCKPKCDTKCDPCKPKCESKCKPKCETKCAPKCETKCAPKCKQNTCTKPKCGGC